MVLMAVLGSRPTLGSGPWLLSEPGLAGRGCHAVAHFSGSSSRKASAASGRAGRRCAGLSGVILVKGWALNRRHPASSSGGTADAQAEPGAAALRRMGDLALCQAQMLVHYQSGSQSSGWSACPVGGCTVLEWRGRCLRSVHGFAGVCVCV